MKRLLHVVSFTSDIERSKAFYRDGIGLSVVADTPFMVNFSHDGGLVLLAVGPDTKREVELCFESDDVSAAVDRLRARGVHFADELRPLAFGSVIHFRDPEGKLLSMLQPGSAARDSDSSGTSSRAEVSDAGVGDGRVALAEAATEAGTGVRISTAIVNCHDLAGAHSYYAHLLGLHVSVDSPAWVQFDTGDIQLAIHGTRDRNATEPHHTQPVSFGFTVPNLETWLEGARERGVTFVSAPTDKGTGLTAEVVDPEGNVVVVREPISEESLEERLAEAYEDDTPGHTSMRNPVRKAARHASWVALRPEYKPAKRSVVANRAEPSAPHGRESEPEAPRGKATARKRPATKSATNLQRERSRPAIGRLKKAEVRVLGTARRAAADKGKTKPVKRAVSRTAAAGRAARKSSTRRGSSR